MCDFLEALFALFNGNDCIYLAELPRGSVGKCTNVHKMLKVGEIISAQ